MTKIWKMGISTDNFIADTVNLTNEEIGIYFRLVRGSACYVFFYINIGKHKKN